MIAFIQIAQMLLDVLWWILVVQIVLSWLISFNVINTHNDFVRSVWTGLSRLTEPLYRPIRRVLPDLGALDLAPLVVLLSIAAANIVLNQVAISYMTGGSY